MRSIRASYGPFTGRGDQRRWTLLLVAMLSALWGHGQGGDDQVRAKADALFDQASYAEAMPLYSQLVSLEPGDRFLNYRYGACLLFGGEDKERAIGHLKYATEDPAIPAEAWYWLGRAYHLSYRFREALEAYQRFKGVADGKLLSKLPVASLEQQCRNGQKLLSNLKEITVRSKVEVEDREFFRYYDLSDIGGRIVVTPDELRSSFDKKNKHRGLVYLPEKPGTIYFSSYGKDGRTGLDIYRTELMPDGRFATPVKLAGFINTDEDEDFPFMHPDGRTFYFSSRGHSSMGGFDVFKAMYDKGLDAFGRPENLDFAVNTPDDEVFYVVDATHGEACFASGRSSRQGKYHVYRVATDRLPLVITVLKGSFANEFDVQDRKARIVVEDALTREEVANVRTDMNGNYVLALPRSGRFRFMVECGPSGRTHVGMVDVPRSDGPKGFRQELTLVRHGDQEKLMIRNYFDDPLDDDLIELAMAEIRRRARLDVSDGPPAVQAEPLTPVPSGDVLTRAGFTGDVDKATALRMAHADAAAQEQQATALGQQRHEAHAIALDAVEEAERSAAEAQQLVEQAARTADEEERNALMTEAAGARQRSREASLRARAAQQFAQDLEVEEMATRQRAAQASKLAADLDGTLGAGRDEQAFPHLVALKERMDARTGPDARPDIAEAARRAVADQERSADRALRQANDKRTEDGELVDRINRLKRERDGTRGKGRQEELDREIAQLEEQLKYLREETEAAFAKAAAMERETAVMRGKASLARHLAGAGAVQRPGPEPTSAQVSTIGQRIAGTESRVAALPIDERFDALLATSPAETEARIFNWELASTGTSAMLGERPTTRPLQRDDRGDARTTTTRTTKIPEEPIGEREPAEREVPSLAVDGDLPSTGRNDTVREPARDVIAGGNAEAPAVGGVTMDPARGAEAEDIATGTISASGAGGDAGDTDRQAPEGDRAAGLSPEQVRNADGARVGGAVSNADADASVDDPFLLENQLAELRQIYAAERNRARRDSLQDRIAELEERRSELEAAARTIEPTVEGVPDSLREELGMATGEAPDLSRVPLVLDGSTSSEEIRAGLFKNYELDKSTLQLLADGDERAEGLQGLELMMADSIRAEMGRQVAVLEVDPGQAERILPRLDRLRRLREEHLALAEKHLADNRAARLDAGASGAAHAARGTVSPADVLDERYVAFAPLQEDVYASDVAFRSPMLGDARARHEADMAIITDIGQRIDSMERVIAGTRSDRERERSQRELNKLRDEQLIARTDMGQRSAYLTREEWTAASDSLQRLDAALVRKGRRVDEPVLVLADELVEGAGRDRDQASRMRRSADREEDIVVRDSLYRTAYATELMALRDLDRAITMRNHVLGNDHVPGEVLSYEQVASKVLDANAVAQATRIDPGAAGPGTEGGERREADVRVEAMPSERTEGDEIPGRPLDGGGVAARDNGDDAAMDAGLTADRPPLEGERPSPSDGQRGQEVPPDPMPGTGQVAPEEGERPSEGTLERTTLPVPGRAANDPAAEEQARLEGREIALAQVRAAMAVLDEAARRPVGDLEDLVVREPVQVLPWRSAGPPDPAALAERSERAARESDALRKQADELRQQAAEKEATTASVKRRERMALQQMAVRDRTLADSLMNASVIAREESRLAAEEQQEAEQVIAFRERLMKFYYLSNDERSIIMENPDHSRYFAARMLAMEQDEAAAEAEAAAVADRELADGMRRDAANAIVAAIGPDAARSNERARVLTEQAALLEVRSDSLDAVAARLRSAAARNNTRAANLLASMEPADATRLADLERGTLATVGLGVDDRSVPRPSPAAGAGGTAIGVPGANVPAPTAPGRMPQVLTSDLFQFVPSGSRGGRPNTIVEEMPGGIVYTVQVGAFRNAVPEGTFGDLSPVMTERLENGLTRYKAGLFTGLGSATAARDLVRARGYSDAFVVVYRDGQRISLAEAQRGSTASDATAGAARSGTPPSTAQVPTTGQPPSGAVLPSGRTTGAPDTLAQRPAGEPLTARTVEGSSGAAGRSGTGAAGTSQAEAPDPAREAVAVLANYPPSAAAIMEAFPPAPDRAAYYNEPGAAPARQVETIQGLFFTVQVGVYSRPVPLDKLFNITPLNSELTDSRKIRYTTGVYLDEDQARERRDQAVQQGVKDAFITAYLNGARIPMRDARVLLERYGNAVLARP